jgi:hypothetical protein
VIDIDIHIPGAALSAACTVKIFMEMTAVSLYYSPEQFRHQRRIKSATGFFPGKKEAAVSS